MPKRPELRYEIMINFPGEPRASDYRPTDFGAAVEYALDFARKNKGVKVQVAVCLESSLLDQPDHLQEHIRYLFRLAREAIEQEPDFRAAPDGRDTVPGDGQQDGGHRGRRGRRATRSQILAIHGIATRQGIDLDGLLRDRYRVCQLYELSVSEASRLIDKLKSSANGAGGQR